MYIFVFRKGDGHGGDGKLGKRSSLMQVSCLKKEVFSGVGGGHSSNGGGSSGKEGKQERKTEKRSKGMDIPTKV